MRGFRLWNGWQGSDPGGTWVFLSYNSPWILFIYLITFARMLEIFLKQHLCCNRIHTASENLTWLLFKPFVENCTSAHLILLQCGNQLLQSNVFFFKFSVILKKPRLPKFILSDFIFHPNSLQLCHFIVLKNRKQFHVLVFPLPFNHSKKERNEKDTKTKSISNI